LSGDVSVQAARAGITASAEAGDVYVGFPFDSVGDARVSTAGGSIHVTVAPSLNCRVNASSVWVESRTSCRWRFSLVAMVRVSWRGKLEWVARS
jgi:hypothetical protein